MYYQVFLSFIIRCHENVENKWNDEYETTLNDIPNTTKDEFESHPLRTAKPQEYQCSRGFLLLKQALILMLSIAGLF